jgi:hypothetical protein
VQLQGAFENDGETIGTKGRGDYKKKEMTGLPNCWEKEVKIMDVMWIGWKV